MGFDERSSAWVGMYLVILRWIGIGREGFLNGAHGG